MSGLAGAGSGKVAHVTTVHTQSQVHVALAFHGV